MKDKLKRLSTIQMSTRLLYLLVGLTVVIFLLFYLVGYDMPYVFDPEYNAPLLTDVVLLFVYAVVGIAVVVAVVSAVRGAKAHARENVVNGIPVARISRGTAMMVPVVLAVTFLLGSASPLVVNGQKFSSVFWLKTTDMFLYTAALLILAATVLVLLSIAGAGNRFDAKDRKVKKQNKQSESKEAK